MDEKRQLLIDTAFQLFYEKGINSVGINEILTVSGIAKKTLYAKFESKDELVLETLMEWDAIFLRWLESELAPSRSYTDVINNLFGALTKWFCNKVPELDKFRGCYFIKASAECTNADSRLFQYCSEHKDRVKSLLRQHLSGVSETTIDQICTLKEGATVMAYLYHDMKAAERCIPVALATIEL